MNQVESSNQRRNRNRKVRRTRRGLALFCTGLFFLSAWILLRQNGGIDMGRFLPFSDSSISESSDFSEFKPNPGGDWRLILVNRWNPIPEDYTVTLTKLKNGHAVDSRIYPDLQKMFDDARAEGIYPFITSSYRTDADQQKLMDEKIVEYQRDGYSADEAKSLAEAWVAPVGTSEHEMGMAVDISTENREVQDANIIWSWLSQNSYRYGFILRYPESKSDITGVIYEPWHYRYVGKEAAKEIYEQGVCLEEYLSTCGH